MDTARVGKFTEEIRRLIASVEAAGFKCDESNDSAELVIRIEGWHLVSHVHVSRGLIGFDVAWRPPHVTPVEYFEDTDSYDLAAGEHEAFIASVCDDVRSLLSGLGDEKVLVRVHDGRAGMTLPLASGPLVVQRKRWLTVSEPSPSCPAEGSPGWSTVRDWRPAGGGAC